MTGHLDLGRRLPRALLALRLSSAMVMVMWAMDKLINPEHAAHVFEKFYLFEDISHLAVGVIGTVQLAIYAGFVLGFQPTVTYTAVFGMHLLSTLSSWMQYINPWSGPNLLFFAAWPMLAAMGVLLYLREHDTLLSYDALRASRSERRSQVRA